MENIYTIKVCLIYSTLYGQTILGLGKTGLVIT